MSAQGQGGPPATKAAEICRHFKLGDEGKKVLTPDIPARQFLNLLAEKKLHTDGIQFIAHYLPKRQAVWWGLSCVKEVLGEKPPKPVAAALNTTERWIAEPTDENRKATLPAAEEAETSTPAGCVAMAAYYADGLPQTADPRQNEKAHYMTAKLVCGGVLLAGASDALAGVSDAAKLRERLEAFFGKGMDVVRRTNPA
jgi:hypothetical protein